MVAEKKKYDLEELLLILKQHGINLNSDFFELSSNQVEKLNELAVAQKYKAPQTKGKSRARAFFESLYKQMHRKNPIKKKSRVRKNPDRGNYKIYSPENRKYFDKPFLTEKDAFDFAQKLFDFDSVPLEIHHNGHRVAKVGKNISRIKNPVKPHVSARQSRVIKAIQLYQRFRVDDPKFVDEINFEAHDVMMAIGIVNAVEYDTKRAGKVEYYRHEFTGKSRPLLASSWDGKQLYLLGGNYNFTDVGIVDVDPITGKEKR